ncbi:MAG: SOS response-associated peptidase [Anaerolineaceae bacterium]
MCGRFSMAIDSDDIQTALALGNIPENWRRRYNIAPSQDVAVVFDPESRDVTWMRWGLVPFWAKDPSIGSKMINARAETIAEKPSYKQSFKHKRCLILADGFYEWKKVGKTSKKGSIPFYFSLKNGDPFAFAGLWDDWEPKGLSPEPGMTTCTIITCPANALVSPIHDRMPVILTGDQAWDWLKTDNEAALMSMLKPAPADLLQDWEVSKAVNDPKNDTTACVQPLGED